MSLLDDPSQVLQRLLVPELRELNERLKTIESRMEESELRAERRHTEMLYALRQASQWAPPQDRFARREYMPLE